MTRRGCYYTFLVANDADYPPIYIRVEKWRHVPWGQTCLDAVSIRLSPEEAEALMKKIKQTDAWHQYCKGKK